jgi:hypothetical protein
MNRIKLEEFARFLRKMDETIGMKMSARGWAYALEGMDIPFFGMVNKGHFDVIENIINKCRKKGLLPVDFVAVEEARKFSGIEIPNTNQPIEEMQEWIEYLLTTKTFGYTPDWWDGEKYYIQMVVEKIDLKTLFEPICKKYHIPIATSKGWSSIIQRAEYALRFKEAEKRGLICILLYCGDHDPDGLRISEFLRKNLRELKYIFWQDGDQGYDPEDLIIDRFGLNYDFIMDNNLTWIENLITGSKKNLASPTHKNYNMPYVQDYLRTVGERKCEANAIVKQKEKGRELCRQIIEHYLGDGALERFRVKRQVIVDEIQLFRERTGLNKTLKKALDAINKETDEE